MVKKKVEAKEEKVKSQKQVDAEIAELKKKIAKLEEKEDNSDDGYVDLTPPKQLPPLRMSKQGLQQQVSQHQDVDVVERNTEKIELPKLPEKEEKANVAFWKKWFKKEKVNKPNKVAVLLLRTNGTGEIVYLDTKNDMFEISGNTYHARSDCTFILYLGKDRIPLCILPEQSMIPLGTKAFYEIDNEVKLAELQNLVIKAIRTAEIVKVAEPEKKGGFNTKTMVIIGILVLIGWGFTKWSGG